MLFLRYSCKALIINCLNKVNKDEGSIPFTRSIMKSKAQSRGDWLSQPFLKHLSVTVREPKASVVEAATDSPEAGAKKASMARLYVASNVTSQGDEGHLSPRCAARALYGLARPGWNDPSSGIGT
jgi:hypothetical protein